MGYIQIEVGRFLSQDPVRGYADGPGNSFCIFGYPIPGDNKALCYVKMVKVSSFNNIKPILSEFLGIAGGQARRTATISDLQLDDRGDETRLRSSPAGTPPGP